MSNKAEENTLRYRRAQSVTKAEEITEKENKARKSQLDKPIHKPRDSLFSWSSEFNDFTGLVNWGFLLLTIGGLRLCLENFIKYGIRVNPFEWIIVVTGYHEGQSHQYPSIILLIFSVVPVVFALLIEKAIAVDIISSKIGTGVQIFNILSTISLPVIMLHFKGQEFSFVGISTVCTMYLVLFLKLWSYVQTNHWCRQGMKEKQCNNKLRRQSLSAPNWNELVNAEQEQTDEDIDASSSGLVKYPDNLNLKDLFYFLLAPTLCYELNFPRTTRIRKRFLIKRILEVVFGMNLVLALFQQWMIPSIRNTVKPFSEMDFIRMTERLLKLAVPNHLIWLCFFYLSFHSFLNLMGELLHFADRNFYNDWWNARNIAVFWSTWNMPVHMWALRHVFKPLMAMGYGKGAAGMVVFVISALFHEYLVSVPLQMFRIWAFLGMMVQPPLAVISKFAEVKLGARWGNIIVSVPLQMFRIWAFLGMMVQPPLAVISKFAEVKLGARWGNIIVWSSLILGQPLAIMMYYHDYALLHFAPES